MAHVSEAKKKELERITKLLKESKNVGILDLTNLPSAQFQKIKSKLKNILQVTVTKKALIKLALEKIKAEKPGIEKLEEDLEKCIPALLFTSEDAFKVARALDKNKSNMAAKPGQITPKDIIIPEGPTEFAPGPIIGELGQAGIVAAVEDGKIVVKEDKLIAKAGDELTIEQTSVIDKFGIEPMEIGLNLKSMYQDGQIFKSDVLSVSEKEYMDNLQNSVREALNLAVFIAYPTQETTEILLQKAEREALALSTKLPEEKEEVKTEEAPKEEEQKETETTEEKKEGTTEEVPKEEPKEETQEQPKEKTKNNDQLNPSEFSKDESEKAQEIINQLKDKEIKQ
jgi:large subunit ribosomal protein L10